ncbi:MAG: bacteriophage abortive infection AbiH family protein [Bacteroidaceae bacterium]|nr:bacteriophage abortive infection AbiH family protein [Bacteroidaceae bacterium]
MSKLFFIGNGFDLNHGLKSQYKDFLEFVCMYHHDKFHRIGSMFGLGNPSFLWKDFEENLANFNVNRSICRNTHMIEYARKHPKKNLTEYTTLENACDGLVKDLSELFQEWVHEFMKDTSVSPKYHLSKDDYYISFNYTSILNSAYRIPPPNICYIHRNAFESDLTRLIFGHGLNKQKILNRIELNKEARNAIKAIKTSEQDVISIYEELLMSLRKDTDSCLSDAKDFFDNFKKNSIDEIMILGHSLGCSDVPYYQKILQYITNSTPIKYSYKKSSECNEIRKQLEKIFNNPNRISGWTMEEMLMKKN